VSELKTEIKSLDPADRPAVGKLVAETTTAIAVLISARREELAADDAVAAGERDRLDLTLGGHGRRRGHLHLVTQVQRELEDIFVGMGYRVVQGPEVEDDWHNFEALNMVPGHPARSMQDTLYLELGDPEQVMLRTHTSPVQIRTMETMEPPIFVVAPGRTYRNETLDARHSPVFHQIEALAVDRGITLADLFGTIETFARRLFDDERIQTRFRPDFFPYTEPSAELAVSCIFCGGDGCRVCSQSGWIELGGCGMVDPNVLQGVGIDPEVYTGFAFGFGLERIAMVRYDIDEIKTFFDGDVRFLAQY
jgi:phenylalanyl-tRNA synthetase alpha chain